MIFNNNNTHFNWIYKSQKLTLTVFSSWILNLADTTGQISYICWIYFTHPSGYKSHIFRDVLDVASFVSVETSFLVWWTMVRVNIPAGFANHVHKNSPCHWPQRWQHIRDISKHSCLRIQILSSSMWSFLIQFYDVVTCTTMNIIKLRTNTKEHSHQRAWFYG